jgi:cold shock CspA family protein
MSELGCCKWFDQSKGYGFITLIEKGDDERTVFVHYSALAGDDKQFKTLFPGEYVSFDLAKSTSNTAVAAELTTPDVATSSKPQLQAINVTGVNGGPLFCMNPANRGLLSARNNRGNQNRTGFQKVKKGAGTTSSVDTTMVGY